MKNSYGVRISLGMEKRKSYLHERLDLSIILKYNGIIKCRYNVVSFVFLK
nr:hypothetical protein [Fusobacterium necrophorum]